MALSMVDGKQLPEFFWALCAITAACLLSLVDTLGFVTERQLFLFLTILLLVYLVIEIVRLRIVEPRLLFLNPIVIASVATFGISYGMSNFMLMVSGEKVEQVGLGVEITPEMVKHAWLAFFSAIAMWLGYGSSFARKLCAPGHRLIARFLPGSGNVRLQVIPVLFAVSLAARFVAIRLGIFGYSSSYEDLIKHASLSQYLHILGSLGKLALLIVALELYSGKARLRIRIWFVVLMAYEVLFGFLSGFKSQVIMPFVIAAICQYVVTSRIAKSYILYVLAGLIAAYSVIEPSRIARHSDSGFEGDSLSSIVGTIITSALSSAEQSVDLFIIAISVVARSSLTHIGSLGIGFVDNNYALPAGSPDFLGNILLAPLHAWIPRLIWDSKPLQDIGLWYTHEVMGLEHFSSTAMGPITYLYFAGGSFGVLVGFFVIGVIQRVFYHALQPWSSLARAIVFLIFLPVLGVIDSSINSIIVTLLREVPLVLIFVPLLFKGRSSYKHVC